MERNVSAFDSDAVLHGGYVYTAIDRWSSRVATARQSAKLIRMLLAHFPAAVHITDIGCGDGAFTLEIARTVHPSSIRGVDPAAGAIDAARRQSLPGHIAGIVSFETGGIYDIENRHKDSGEPSLAVVRGVLHHLDDPRAAIARLACEFTSVLVLEPNGYNPIMKAIEKFSSYHRQHDEKSYWPPALNRWFRGCGYSVVEQRFFGLVPYFCPTTAAKVLNAVEPLIEPVPLFRQIACGTNLVLYRRAA
jgi:SAM-dependent methyltransferase